MQNVADKKNMTFTDYLRIRFKGILDTIGTFLNHLGLKPNTITFLGLIGNGVGAYLLARGLIVWGGVVILLMGPLDALDGTMARLRGENSTFGAFIDSVTDRYSELLIFLGLLVFYMQKGDLTAIALVYLAAAGSVMVSYVKARAEALGFEAKVGLLTRVERYLVLVPALIFNLPIIGLWILAIFTNFTAVQRFVHVRSQAKHQLDALKK